MPSGPGKDSMPGFAYRLFLADGTEVGEAFYAVPIKPDDCPARGRDCTAERVSTATAA
jgi:hypothetical protein